MKILFLSSNVGSLFENTRCMQPLTETLLKLIRDLDPDFVILGFQVYFDDRKYFYPELGIRGVQK